jgi:hypothetical protein
MAKELYYTKLLLVRHGQAREEDGSYLLTTSYLSLVDSKRTRLEKLFRNMAQ